MNKGLITSLLIKLTIDYWYFSLVTLLIKFIIIRFIATNNTFKAVLVWITGTVAFYCMACITGILFSSLGFYYIPFVMFIFAASTELLFSSIIFRIESRKLLSTVILGNGLFFFLLFGQML